MSDEDTSLATLPRVMGRISDKVWQQIRKDVIEYEGSSVDYDVLSAKYGVAASSILNKATKRGWLEERRRINDKGIHQSLERVGTQLAAAVSDIYQSLQGMIEAAQQSYGIRVVRDQDGDIHFLGSKPENVADEEWDQLSELQRRMLAETIPVDKLRSFLETQLIVIDRKIALIRMTAQQFKGSLPKFEPHALDFSRRDGLDISREDVEGLLTDLKVEKPGVSKKKRKRKDSISNYIQNSLTKGFKDE